MTAGVRTGRRLAGEKVPEPTPTAADITGLRGFVARTPGASSESIERFYEQLADAREARRTLGFLAESQQPEEGRRAAEQRQNEIARLPQLEAAARTLSELRAALDMIRRDPNMTPDDKRDRIDRVGPAWPAEREELGLGELFGGKGRSGPQPLVECQTDPIAYARDILGVPEHTLRWSLNDGYGQHRWDGTPDPIAATARSTRTRRSVRWRRERKLVGQELLPRDCYPLVHWHVSRPEWRNAAEMPVHPELAVGGRLAWRLLSRRLVGALDAPSVVEWPHQSSGCPLATVRKLPADRT